VATSFRGQLIGFYTIIEVLGYRKWSFPLVVVGMNSIFIYFVSEVLREWLDRAVGVFTFPYSFIGTLAPVAQGITVVLVMWYLCYWRIPAEFFSSFRAVANTVEASA
jgi:predicted acyltransferase